MHKHTHTHKQTRIEKCVWMWAACTSSQARVPNADVTAVLQTQFAIHILHINPCVHNRQLNLSVYRNLFVWFDSSQDVFWDAVMIRIFAGMCEPPAAQLDLERGIQKRGCKNKCSKITLRMVKKLMYLCLHLQVHVHMSICLCAVYVCVYAREYVFMYVCMFICTYIACLHTHTSSCTHAHTHTRTHTYTHTPCPTRTHTIAIHSHIFRVWGGFD